MVTSAHSSSLARYPKWVLVATGFVAAYGTYLVWTNLPSTDPAAIPHRRTTVRPRRERRSSTAFRSSPSGRASHPFGVLHIDNNGNSFRYAVGPEPPTVVEIQDALNVSTSAAENIVTEAQEVSLRCILKVLLEFGDDLSEDLTRHFQALLIPLRTRNIQDLIRHSHLFCTGIWNYDRVTIAKIFTEHCGLDRVPLDLPLNVAITENSLDSDHGGYEEPAQGIKGLLYNIAEEQAKRHAYIHRGISCEICGELPIRGVRWHCLNCPNFDLCSQCEAQNAGIHPKTHVFAKIKIPLSTLAQPHHVHDLWYPGDGQRHWPILDVSLRKRLVTETGLEDVQVEALYEQFCCLANVAVPDDPPGIDAAIDRRAFNKAMISEKWRRPLEPNFLFDRMFSFYDTDNNGIIDFAEFAVGLAFLRKSSDKRSLKPIFQGYDVDGDGYVSRRDFVRMLTAKYAVQKHITRDVIAAEELDLVHHNADIVRSSQPISAAFPHDDIPLGEMRIPQMKATDQFGEQQIRVSGHFGQAVLPNGEEPPDSNFIGAVTARYGVNPWPEEMVQSGMVTMEHAMNVRNRFTRAENVPLSNSEPGDPQSFMVETDSRVTRGRPDLDPPEERWKQDILDANQGDCPEFVENQKSEQNLQFPQHILERGRSYQVPAAEKDFGQEVIFQVMQEGINELLEPLFKTKERLAKSVRDTREERQRLRKEIDDYVREKKVFQEELTAAAAHDPLIATADAAYSRTPDEDTVGPSNDYEQLDGQGRRFDVALRGGADVPPPSQTDIAHAIRQQIAQENEALPMDDAGLEEMETSIREQPLEDLLASAGFSVASPIEERHPPSLLNEVEQEDQAADQADTSSTFEDHSDSAATTPCPSQDMTIQELEDELLSQQAYIDALSHEDVDNGRRAETQALITNLEERITRLNASVPSENDNQGLTAFPEESELDDYLEPESPDVEEQSDATNEESDSTNEESDSTNEESDHANEETNPSGEVMHSGRSSPLTPPAAPMQTPFSTPSMMPSSSMPPLPPPQTTGRPELPKDTANVPSKQRLDELAQLDEEEKMIRMRGGPARLNLEEFETIILRDRHEGGLLAGMVEGWLEWAAF